MNDRNAFGFGSDFGADLDVDNSELLEGIVPFDAAGPLLFGLHDRDFELPPGFVSFGTTSRLIFEIRDDEERAA